jgi:Flp pilus assembly protein TadB
MASNMDNPQMSGQRNMGGSQQSTESKGDQIKTQVKEKVNQVTERVKHVRKEDLRVQIERHPWGSFFTAFGLGVVFSGAANRVLVLLWRALGGTVMALFSAMMLKKVSKRTREKAMKKAA